jgi:hypothetical protein
MRSHCWGLVLSLVVALVCNMSVERRCEAEFKAYGGNGTPFLVIRRGGKEHHMEDGFDSDEFLAALRS